MIGLVETMQMTADGIRPTASGLLLTARRAWRHDREFGDSK